MGCTTLLVGKDASYDGSTMIARNDDSPSGEFGPKKFTVVHPNEQPRVYTSVLSHVTIRCAIRQFPMPSRARVSGQPAASMRPM